MFLTNIHHRQARYRREEGYRKKHSSTRTVFYCTKNRASIIRKQLFVVLNSKGNTGLTFSKIEQVSQFNVHKQVRNNSSEKRVMSRDLYTDHRPET
jgi:hypothetical protein